MTPLDGLLIDEQPLGVLPAHADRRPQRRRRRRRSAQAKLIAAAEQAHVSGLLLEGALDEHVHEVSADLAADVNNGGIARQVAFLVGTRGVAAATDLLAVLGVRVTVARGERATRARVLTRRQLRTSTKNGTRISQWVHQRGRVYANLIEPDGRPRTIRVDARRRRGQRPQETRP